MQVQKTENGGPTIVFTNSFLKEVKKLPATAYASFGTTLSKIIKDPSAGDPKTGPLKGLSTMRFKLNATQQARILYMELNFKGKKYLCFVKTGSRESFYDKKAERALGSKIKSVQAGNFETEPTGPLQAFLPSSAPTPSM